ncbi:hypothetical protein VTK26DRAFT_5503 [Humicola hyalothermophila]
MRALLRFSSQHANQFLLTPASVRSCRSNLFLPPRSIRLQLPTASFGSATQRFYQRPKPPKGYHSLNKPRVASASGLLFAFLAAVLGVSAYYSFSSKETVSPAVGNTPELFDDMPAEIAPGRPGNLTPEQEQALRRLWQLIFQVCNFGQENGSAADNGAATPSDKEPDSKKEKKGRMSLFSRKSKKDTEADSSATAAAESRIVLNLSNGDHDKYGQTKQFYETLAKMSPEAIRDTIWSMIKHDHPDALMLRFLRARKWDVERALIMLVSTMSWRATEMKVDEDIMPSGEAAALEVEKNSSDPTEKKLAQDFMTQIRKGISYVHGVDKQGRPLCFVNVRLHRQGEQAEEALERYTVYLIETCRMLLQPPVDTATIVFDMTNFSMANMDYTPVKFMIKCFEANYPESLGAVLVHKAPWIFQGIWKVIRGWLDPVVANKVHFTNNAKEMEEFIDMKHIPKDLDGEEDWTYSYVEPSADENEKLKDTATRDRLLAARSALYKEFDDATLEWIRAAAGDEEGGSGSGKTVAEIKARREAIAERLREDYWVVDPYLRARSYYDRTGVLLPGGKLKWYSEGEGKEKEKEKETGEVPANGSAEPAAQTSAADLD